MQIWRYSEPDFDPYEDEDRGTRSPQGGPTPWRAPRATAPITARLSIPGSKSLTARELVLSALADAPSRLSAPLFSRDTTLMIEALSALGTRIERGSGTGEFGDDLLVTPADELVGSTTIECGLAGTVMRFVPVVAGLALGPTLFDGDEAARARPMAITIESLRSLGVDIADEARRSLPFTVHGTGRIPGGKLEINAWQSSQFISGLLLAAARFEHGLDLTHAGGRLPSSPHIDMTIRALQDRGVTVTKAGPDHWTVEPGPIRGREVLIEPDLSNAAPFLAAAVLTGGTVTINDWPITTTQVGARLTEYLAAFGARVEQTDTTLTVSGTGTIRGVHLDLADAGELAPSLVALAALADSPSEIIGIGHIRGHETDRIAALTQEINGLGGAVTELSDGLRIEPAQLHGGMWQTYGDHRMATSGAIIGLAVTGIEIDNIGATTKTLPQFQDLWNRLLI